MRFKILTSRFVFAGWLICLTAASGLSAERPDWIWDDEPRDGETAVFLRKEFSISRPLRQATLLGATDFAHAELHLNGRQVGEIANFSLPLRADVTKLLKPGPNVIAAFCQSAEGPSAAAFRIELEFRDGSRQAVLSDESWSASRSEKEGWQKTGFQSDGSWKPAQSFGRVTAAMLPIPEADTAINPLDDYTQWKQASDAEEGTDPSKFFVSEGFEIERLRSARESEGSWVSIVFDPQGRLIVGKEDQGLLRMTLPETGGELRVETINDSLKECRGLLFAHGSLYASANNSKGLYRLRDTDGDEQFDEVKLLYQSGGGVGHGRNDLALGPDGKIYQICGDSVDLPRDFLDLTSPFREHSQGRKSNEGHLLRFNADGSGGEIVAAGLRNPYGIAFGPHGEAVTYDADAEYDMGSPWYRPTRIVHLTAGSDYGWRGVTKSWPPYYPDHADNAPPVLDIGKGSPTGVKFGTNSNFPARYRDSLFVLDWAYGRILMVELTPKGSSFVGRASTFLKGQPFNVTDLDFGPDGAMYVVTGGRKTQSALYRVRYIGKEQSKKPPTAQQIARDEHAKQARRIRRELENLLQTKSDESLAKAWPHLNSEDPWIRYAARNVVEHQPLSAWQEKALTETRPTAALNLMLALVRVPEKKLGSKVIGKLLTLPLAELSEPEKLMAVDAYRLCLENDEASLAERDEIRRQLLALFPHQSVRINLAILQVLAQIESPALVPSVLEWLPGVPEQSARLHGLFLLRGAKKGWTEKRREMYFTGLLNMREFQGGEGMPTFIRRIEADALASLDESVRPKFESMLARKLEQEPLPEQTRPLVKEWKIDDFANDLAKNEKKHDFDLGQKLFREALCIRCHRVGFEGAAVGPDLTSAGRRFGRRDLLESILTPSKVVAEQYRLATIITKGGETLTGQIIPSRDYRSPELHLATKPLEPYEITKIPKSEIESHKISQVSVMPKDLLNRFTKKEILELLAWLEAGGNPRHPNYE